MALTESKMLALGTPAPAFNLLEPATGKMHSLDELKSSKATVIVFMCNHCPFVKHIIDKLSELADDYQQEGVKFIGINSNDVANFPEDAPEKMIEFAAAHQLSFPYLFDETQKVAKAYDAACTPDFFVFDKDLRCVYRGRFDDARPGNDHPVTGDDLREALDAVLDGEEVFADQHPSMGCNIKWKAS